MNKKTKAFLVLAPFVILFISVYFYYYYEDLDKKKALESQKNNQQLLNKEPNSVPQLVARTVVSLIQSREFEGLASYISNKGVWIKPYYVSDKEQGRKLNKYEIGGFFNDMAKRDWGYQDGSGLKIMLTDKEYYEKYIGTHDYLGKGKVSFDQSLVQGNTLPLDTVLKDLFPDTNYYFVEYYVEGQIPEYGGMDWGSIAVVFEYKDSEWKIIGILHNEWTI